MRDIIKKIFCPNKILGFLIFNIAFGLLVYVFSCHLEGTLLAYISYPLSAYALTIFCIWFYKVCKFSSDSIKTSKVYNIYQNHFILITKTLLSLSLAINLVYGIFKLLFGVYYRSWWLITFAIYYLLLCFMKLSLVKNLDNKEKDYKKLKHTGMVLLFLNIILIGIIVLILKQNQVIKYNGLLIYLVALYDFYLIISAFINVFKYRKNHSPIILASKCINLTVAMISMISLAVAMITEFGDNDLNFKYIMISCMGFGICLINSFMAIYMIVNASKCIR